MYSINSEIEVGENLMENKASRRSIYERYTPNETANRVLESDLSMELEK